MRSKVQEGKKHRLSKKSRSSAVERDNQIPSILMSIMSAGVDLPEYSNVRSIRQTQILQKQRVLGNAHVQRLLTDRQKQQGSTNGRAQEKPFPLAKVYVSRRENAGRMRPAVPDQANRNYYLSYNKHDSIFLGNEITGKRADSLLSNYSSFSSPPFSTRKQTSGLQLAPAGSAVKRPPSKKAQRIFLWLEAPLQKAVKDPAKIDGWTDARVTAMVLMYNKLRNEGLWGYVKEIKDASDKVSLDFYPAIDQNALKDKLPSHGYGDCMASWGLDWGLRKVRACGPHLHFKHFNAGDDWINVHIDKIDPCCGVVPIIGPIISGLRHRHHDLKNWSKRNPDQFLAILKKQGVPLSTGVLRYLKSKGYLAP